MQARSSGFRAQEAHQVEHYKAAVVRDHAAPLAVELRHLCRREPESRVPRERDNQLPIHVLCSEPELLEWAIHAQFT